MKKKLKSISLTTKSILILLLCAVIIILIASPIIHKVTFDLFNPYLEENLILKTSDGAAYMSTFLSKTNPKLRALVKRNTEFLNNVNDQANNTISSDQFNRAVSEIIEPISTKFTTDDNSEFSADSYPVIYIENKGVFCSDVVSDVASNIVESEWFEDYKNNMTGRDMYAPIAYQEENGVMQGYFSFIHSGYSDYNNGIKYYAILLTNFSDLMPLWESVLQLNIDDYGFIGHDNSILYKNNESTEWDINWINEHVAKNRQHYVITHEENDSMYYSTLVSYEEEELRFVMRVSKDIYSDLFKSNELLIQSIFFVIIFVLMMIIFIIFKQIFKRLTALSEKMAVVQEGNFNVTLDDSSGDEIGQLASVFNVMTSTIQDNINKLVEKEHREKMLQYNLMVSAIDPHFVYNTLNTSTRLAELGRADEVVIVNDALINCLKDNLKMKNYQAFCTVASEIDTLEQYITIQNYLCDNTITLKYSISEENMQLEIPKFLLQPLVENSILHGIMMNIDSNGNMIAGLIEVDAEKTKERIRIKVKDNGIGMSQETIQQYFYTDENIILNENAHIEHIGVLNMRTRLSHLYNDNYSVTVKSELGKGTEIIIEIPINQ